MQCMWDSLFLVHAPEGVIEMYIGVGTFQGNFYEVDNTSSQIPYITWITEQLYHTLDWSYCR